MITCPHCNSDEDQPRSVYDNEEFIMKCAFCGESFKVSVWIDFDTRKISPPNPEDDRAVPAPVHRVVGQQL
jgi:hypothetical protein